MSVATQSIEKLAIDTIRTLSMDGVEAANSGHPGTPMALAPVAYTVWQRYLRYDPEAPRWPNRDRFVLSCGHASMLLYSVLHLAGVKELDASGKPTGKLAVELSELKRFRQLHSKTPGHPEYHHTEGVETTTGPLGAGVGNSVGMAIASRWLASRYNQPGFELFDYDVYTLCSDGDLMEGISSEAASIAGHLKLSNLVWMYDDNEITIEGETSLAFSEDVGKRFESYGWNVLHLDDANDVSGLSKALETFKKTTDRPTLIIVKSHIGYGSPNKQDSHEAHGAPLGAKEIAATKAAYGWPADQSFLVPSEVPEHFQSGVGARGAELRAQWDELFAAYKAKHPELAAQLEQIQNHELPAGWDAKLPTFPADAKGVATRVSSGKVLEATAQGVPWMLGGSADLHPSTKTYLTFAGAGRFQPGEYGGRNFHFGIREHAMGAIVNGLTLSGLRGYGSTFLVFADYCRPTLRLAAIMGIPSVFVFTHDSIGVGEDGPTHQPIEHLSTLRAIPNLLLVRPGDANEATELWRTVMPIKNQPSAFILTRQNLPTLDRTKYAPATGAAKGGYVVADAADGQPKVILIATGSELSLAVAAYEKLKAEGIAARVVSLPCWELFDAQPAEYRESVLPKKVKARTVVEMASSFGWHRFAGDAGTYVTIDHFGASAPLEHLLKEFGFTVENVVAAAKTSIANAAAG